MAEDAIAKARAIALKLSGRLSFTALLLYSSHLSFQEVQCVNLALIRYSQVEYHLEVI